MLIYGVVYGLYDPHTEELRYIGQTKRTLRQRLSAHLGKSNLAAHHKSANWISSLDQPPIIKALGCAETKEELDRLEIRLISEARARGVRLTNLADGGGGTSGFEHSLEARRKMSVARKGVPKSTETRAKMAESYANKPLSVGARRRISAAQSGKVKSEKHRQKLSEALRGRTGRKCSAETRVKMSEAAKKREALKREVSHGQV